MVHVTGGGFYENIPRMYPKAKDGKKQLISVIKRSSWDIPPVFGELIKRGADLNTIYNTFNMGIGMCLIIPENEAQKAIDILKEAGEEAYLIGEVIEGNKEVVIE